MRITAQGEFSRSHSILAAVFVDADEGRVLDYEYRNEPLAGAKDAMQIHYGTAKTNLASESISTDFITRAEAAKITGMCTWFVRDDICKHQWEFVSSKWDRIFLHEAGHALMAVLQGIVCYGIAFRNDKDTACTLARHCLLEFREVDGNVICSTDAGAIFTM